MNVHGPKMYKLKKMDKGAILFRKSFNYLAFSIIPIDKIITQNALTKNEKKT